MIYLFSLINKYFDMRISLKLKVNDTKIDHPIQLLEGLIQGGSSPNLGGEHSTIIKCKYTTL